MPNFVSGCDIAAKMTIDGSGAEATLKMAVLSLAEMEAAALGVSAAVDAMADFEAFDASKQDADELAQSMEETEKAVVDSFDAFDKARKRDEQSAKDHAQKVEEAQKQVREVLLETQRAYRQVTR